jgi:acyl-CoA synthetase (AMP-forming)/AMP-acid ligase II
MIHPAHICDLILYAAQSERRDEPAFIYPESTLTWAQMEFDIRAVAGSMSAFGIKKGDSVAVLLPNLPLHPILAFAAPMIGAAYMPIDPSRSMDQVAKLLRHPVPAAVFIRESQVDALTHELRQIDLHIPVFPVGENGFILGDEWQRDAKPWEDSPVGDGDALAIRRHTSGVSQESQLVSLSHQNLLSATRAVRKALQVLPTSVLYGTHAFHNSFGYLFQMLLPAWTNCTLHTCRHWSAKKVSTLLRDSEITAYIGAASHFEQLLPELQVLQTEEVVAEAEQIVSSEAKLSSDEVDPPSDESAKPAPEGGENSAKDSSDVDDSSPAASEEKTEPDTSLIAESSSESDCVHSHSPLRKLRFALCVGAHSDLRVLSDFANSLGCPVATAYGSAESSGIISLNPAHFDPSCPDSVGRTISGLEVSIRNDEGELQPPNQIGEIWLRGQNVFDGYENGDLLPIEDGWYASSDLGYFDENQWLYLVSRKEDRIVRGGFSIYPNEVEDVLKEHDGIQECAIVGRPDINYGQEVVAFIVPNSDTVPSDQDLKDFCAKDLPRYKTPTLFMTINQLPRSESNFILRRELRNRLHGAA